MNQVLVHLDKSEIPPKYVLKRWRKNAIEKGQQNEMCTGSTVEEESFLKRVLISKTMEVVSGRASVLRSGIFETLNALSACDAGTENVAVTKCCAMGEENMRLQNILTSCPDRTIKGGRPPSTGMKACLASRKRKCATEHSENDSLAQDWPDDENPPTWKKKRILDIV